METRILRKPQSAADAFEEKVSKLVADAGDEANESLIRKAQNANCTGRWTGHSRRESTDCNMQ